MIHVREKPVVQPLGPQSLLEMVPYKVVERSADFTECDVGDIILRFPSGSAGTFILNCTRQRMFFDRSQRDAWCQSFKCLRAFHIESITFAIDQDDRP